MPISTTMAPGHPMDQKERKKLQNRRNQRARRLRLREQQPNKDSRQPFEVHRWRLDENDSPSSGESDNTSQNGQDVASLETTAAKTKPEKQVTATTPDKSLQHQPRIITVKGKKGCFHDEDQFFERLMAFPSPVQENLPRLIEANLLRGMLRNKYLLGDLAEYQIPGKTSEETYAHLQAHYPSSAVLVPVKSGLPKQLRPTALQRAVLHSIWIDVIPFPQIRDNLIQCQDKFDHADLMYDVIGTLIEFPGFQRPKTWFVNRDLAKLAVPGRSDRDTIDAQRGFILWGEPHVQESWEVTRGYVRKWGWTLVGCDEIVKSTNYWRSLRGERPLL